MSVNWSELVQQIQSDWLGPIDVGREALDLIVGAEAIKAAVEIAVDFDTRDWDQEHELTEYTLIKMQSLIGSEWAYHIYRNDLHSNKGRHAVALICKIAHPRAFAWLPDFLSDPNAEIGWQAMDFLDHFIINPEWPLELEDIEPVLQLAATHPSVEVRARVEATRNLFTEEAPDYSRYLDARDRAQNLGLEEPTNTEV